MTSVGGDTPEELGTLLEDALLLRDADAVAWLFDDGSLLVAAEAGQQVCGREEIVEAAAVLAGDQDSWCWRRTCR